MYLLLLIFVIFLVIITFTALFLNRCRLHPLWAYNLLGWFYERCPGQWGIFKYAHYWLWKQMCNLEMMTAKLTLSKTNYRDEEAKLRAAYILSKGDPDSQYLATVKEVFRSLFRGMHSIIKDINRIGKDRLCQGFSVK